MPDLEAFKSPITGEEIRGRRAMREHYKQHGVTHTSDYKNEWEQKAKERARAFTPGGGYDRERRIEAIKYAVDKHYRRK